MDRFQDRSDAGWQLAQRLTFLKGRGDVLIVGMARGGVPVAYEIALAMRAPMDVLTVEKLVVPGNEELAVGAIAPGNTRTLNPVLVQDLGLTASDVDEIAGSAVEELKRRDASYHAGRPAARAEGKVVVLVDDGVATGTTIHVAARYLKSLKASKIIVAVPVIPETTLEELKPEVDAILCLATPEPFCGVANWYYDFTPVTDAQVSRLLKEIDALNPITLPTLSEDVSHDN